MKAEKRQKLLNAVKAAVSRYGVDGASTRIISGIAGVNDGHIYHLFEDRDDLILKSYMLYMTEFVDAIAADIDSVRGQLHLKEGARVVFHNAWRRLIDDPDFCRFALYYYHSPNFKLALEFHKGQVNQLLDKIDWLYESRTKAERALYSVFNLLFDFCGQVVSDRLENSEDTEESAFQLFYTLLFSQSNRAE